MYELIMNKHDPPIGLRDRLRFHEYEVTLSPGDFLFEYTDSVTEATSASEELFGEDRLIQALNSDPDAVPHAQIERVYEAIHAFVKEAPQFDDITMLCIQYKGSDACEENRIQMQKTAALSAARSGLSDRAGCHGEL